MTVWWLSADRDIAAEFHFDHQYQSWGRQTGRNYLSAHESF